MNRCQNIFLVGMMGAGKTTVGRQLAKRLGKHFYDCDQEIEARTGVRIPTIFEIEGEAGFRAREVQMIDLLTQERGVVLATGGGAVLDPANREHLRQRGTVFYLYVPPRLLYERTRHDRNRPLLQVPDPLARIETLADQRDPYYREVADFVIEGCVGAQGAVRRIEAEMEKKCAA